MSRNACFNENDENSSKSSMILRADFVLPDLTKIFQNRHLRYASFASTNLTKIRPNRKIHEHSPVRQNLVKSAIFVTACISGQKRASALLLILSFLFLPFFFVKYSFLLSFFLSSGTIDSAV